jgi:hypothetical protein
VDSESDPGRGFTRTSSGNLKRGVRMFRWPTREVGWAAVCHSLAVRVPCADDLLGPYAE